MHINMLFLSLLVWLSSLFSQAFAQCGGTFTNPSGTMTSPNYPSYYSNNLLCDYYVTTEIGTIIAVQFSYFEVEEQSSCLFDVVRFYDGPNVGAREIGFYCHESDDIGKKPPLIVKTSGHEMVMRFKTDGSVLDTGFNAMYWTSLDCQTAQFDLIFAVESSNNIGGSSNFEHLKTFMKHNLLGMAISAGNIRIGVVIFNSDSHVQFDLMDYGDKDAVLSAIDAISYISGTSNVTEGLRSVREEMFVEAKGDRSNANNIVILLIGGDFADAENRAIMEAEAAKDQGIRVRIVAVNAFSTPQMESMVSSPLSENMFYLSQLNQLPELHNTPFYPLCYPRGRHYAEMVSHQDNIIFYVDEKYSFFCNSSSFEEDIDGSYLWYQNGQLINETLTPNTEIYMNPAFELWCTRRFLSFFPFYPYDFSDSYWDAPNVLEVDEQYIIQVNISVLQGSLYPGTNVILSCDATLIPGYNPSVDYGWSSASVSGRNLSIFLITAEEHVCAAATSNRLFQSSPFLIEPREMPQPTINSTGQVSLFFSGNSYDFTCSRPPPEVNATGYVFNINGVEQETNNDTTTIQMIGEEMELSCAFMPVVPSIILTFSDIIIINITVIPRPVIEVIENDTHFLVDRSYSLHCKSDFASNATDYIFSVTNRTTVCATINETSEVNSTNDSSNFTTGNETAANGTVTCTTTNQTTTHMQAADRLVVMATEYINDVSCAVVVDQSVSMTSAELTVLGSGIETIAIQASNLSPWAGTYVILNCLITLVTGYNESDVAFSLFGGSDVISRENSSRAYMTTGIERVVHCVASTGLLDVISSTLSIVPQVLPSPTITINNEPSNGIYILGYIHILICQSDPIVEELVTGYRWRQNGRIIEDTEKPYKRITAQSFTHNYTCSILVNLEESTYSTELEIQTHSIENVHIENSGEQSTVWRPVFDAALTLTCAVTLKRFATEEPTYEWYDQDSVLVETRRQYAMTIYPGYLKDYQCLVRVGNDSMMSETVSVIAQATLQSPSLVLLNENGRLQFGHVTAGRSYGFRCFSLSHSDNTSISWTKDGTIIPCVEDMNLQIQRYLSKLHHGQIQCQINIFDQTSGSNILELMEQDQN